MDFFNFKSQIPYAQKIFKANGIVMTCQQGVHGEQVSLWILFMQTSMGPFLLYQIVEIGIIYALLMILIINHRCTC